MVENSYLSRSMPECRDKSKLSLSSGFLLFIYYLINMLFVWKYSPDYGIDSSLAIIGYTVFFLSVILIVSNMHKFFTGFQFNNISYFVTTGVMAVLLTVLLVQFDPSKIHVGRYPAIHEWISKFLRLEFPYDSSANPSGFPFLFVLAMPFYLLSDIGFLQTFTFVAFALALYLLWPDKALRRFRLILLLVASPAFMYEIVVRSELFGNMALIILYLTALELFTRRNETIFSLLFGLAGGFLLSTRGIVLPIYIIFLGFMIIRKMLKATLFLPSLIGGFLLTLLPFAVWNWNYFVLHGPFAIQLSYIPIWLLVSFILISIILALRIASIKRIYFAISLMLFGIILIPFFISIVRHGFYASVRLDEFDISYFCFTIPFLLIALGGAENGQESTRLLPKTASSIAPR